MSLPIEGPTHALPTHLAAGAFGAGRSAESLARALETEPGEAAARKFEALFATMLVKEMRKALPEGFFGSGADGDIYGGWFDEHLGAALARDDGLRLRAVVETALTRKIAAQAYEAGAGSAEGRSRGPAGASIAGSLDAGEAP